MFSTRLFGSASALGLAFSLLSLHPAAAQTPAIGFAPGYTGFESNAAYDLSDPAGSYSLGFTFTANSPVYVTALGYFSDPSYNSSTTSFTDSHQVGLYQVDPGASGTGTLVASTVVTNASTANGPFVYQTLLSPLQLIAGDNYVLAGVTGPTDPYIFDVQDINGNSALLVDPAITYGQDRVVTSDTLVFPGSTDAISEPGYFGPNMLTSPVPEASTTTSFGLLLGLGLAGLGLNARRRARLSC